MSFFYKHKWVYLILNMYIKLSNCYFENSGTKEFARDFLYPKFIGVSDNCLFREEEPSSCSWFPLRCSFLAQLFIISYVYHSSPQLPANLYSLDLICYVTLVLWAWFEFPNLVLYSANLVFHSSVLVRIPNPCSIWDSSLAYLVSRMEREEVWELGVEEDKYIIGLVRFRLVFSHRKKCKNWWNLHQFEF
jgi:hypothetical protein